MIQRLIAVTIGGVATFAFLLFWDATDFTEPVTAYAIAAIVGAVGSLIWPVIVGFWFARRARARRDARIQDEVDRQLADRGK